jgi:hypothetical protein
MAKVQKFGFGGFFGGRGRPAPQPPMNPGMQPQLGQAVRAGIPPAELQRLQQMQGMLQGNPIGGNPRQIAQPPATQMPTAQTGLGMVSGGAGPAFANQIGQLGTAGMGLQQQFGGAGSLANLPSALRDPMKPMPAGMKKGGAVKKKPKKMASGGKVSSASKRADGCAIKGKTRGKMM